MQPSPAAGGAGGGRRGANLLERGLSMATEELREIFNGMDASRDGRVSMEEFTRVFCQHHPDQHHFRRA